MIVRLGRINSKWSHRTYFDHHHCHGFYSPRQNCTMNYCVNNHLYCHKPTIGNACPLLANVGYNTSYLLKQKNNGTTMLLFSQIKYLTKFGLIAWKSKSKMSNETCNFYDLNPLFHYSSPIFTKWPYHPNHQPHYWIDLFSTDTDRCLTEVAQHVMYKPCFVCLRPQSLSCVWRSHSSCQGHSEQTDKATYALFFQCKSLKIKDAEQRVSQ